MTEPIKLCEANLHLIPSNVLIPKYNRQDITASIVHIGVGGFHRSHMAYYADRLISEHGITDCGICGIGLLEFDRRIYETMTKQDCLYTLMVREHDGSVNSRVIGSIVQFLFAPEESEKVIEKMASSDVKIISLTITEGGYNFNESTRAFNYENKAVQGDVKNLHSPKTVFGYLTKALQMRMHNGSGGCSIQSCDNIQGNGDLTKAMLSSFIKLVGQETVVNLLIF